MIKGTTENFWKSSQRSKLKIYMKTLGVSSDKGTPKLGSDIPASKV